MSGERRGCAISDRSVVGDDTDDVGTDDDAGAISSAGERGPTPGGFRSPGPREDHAL